MAGAAEDSGGTEAPPGGSPDCSSVGAVNGAASEAGLAVTGHAGSTGTIEATPSSSSHGRRKGSTSGAAGDGGSSLKASLTTTTTGEAIGGNVAKSPVNGGPIRRKSKPVISAPSESTFQRSLARLDSIREELLRLHDGEIAALQQDNARLQRRLEELQAEGKAEVKTEEASEEVSSCKPGTAVVSAGDDGDTAAGAACAPVGDVVKESEHSPDAEAGNGETPGDPSHAVGSGGEAADVPHIGKSAGDKAAGAPDDAESSNGTGNNEVHTGARHRSHPVLPQLQVLHDGWTGGKAMAEDSSTAVGEAGTSSLEVTARSAPPSTGLGQDCLSTGEGRGPRKHRGKRSVVIEDASLPDRECPLATHQHSASSCGSESRPGDSDRLGGVDDLPRRRSERSVTVPDRLCDLPGTPQYSPGVRPVLPEIGRSSEVGVAITRTGAMEMMSTASRCSSKESGPHYNPLDPVIETDQRFQVLNCWDHDEVVLRPISQSWETLQVDTPSRRVGAFNGTARLSNQFSFKTDSLLSFDAGFFKSWVVQPFCKKRMVWDFLCVIFVASDVIFVPLYFFEMPQTSVTTAAGWVGRIFWVFDIIASLLTGLYIKGILEMSPRVIARQYFRTWFFPDLLILIAQWVPVFFDVEDNQHMWPVMVFLRGARVLRLFRMLQLLKVQMVLHEIGTKFSIHTNFAFVGVVKFLMLMAISVHFTACIWYGIGTSREDGWVYCQGLEGASIIKSYMASLHWTLAQFHGNSAFHAGNFQEHAFSNGFACFGFVVACNMVGVITNMRMQMDLSRSNEMRQQRLLCGYLKHHRISAEQAMRARVHLESKCRQEKEELLQGDQTKAVLASLPQSLQLDIAEEMHGPVMMSYSFLIDISVENSRIVRHLCHEALQEVTAQASEVIFSSGDICPRMLFVMSGTAGYTLMRRPSSPRIKGHLGNGTASTPGGIQVPVIEETGDDDPDDLLADMPRDVEHSSNVGGEMTYSRSTNNRKMMMRSRSPSDGNMSNILLNCGDFVSEAALWTTWEYCGEFAALTRATLLALDTASFQAVISRNLNAYSYAVRYARIFVKRLNTHAEISDVLRFHLVKSAVESEPFECRTNEEPVGVRSSSKSMACVKRNMRRLERFSADGMTHFMFISHHKAEAGTEAALMQEALERKIHEDQNGSGYLMKAPVFLDSEDLSDLSQLKEHVQKSRNLVVLLTKEVLERPWVLVEIVTASHAGVNIVPVEVQKKDMSFNYPDEVFFSKLLDGTALSEDAARLLLNEGISLDDLEKTLRKVFKKIAVPFSPHKSGSIRDAELGDILRRCQDAAVDLS